jgi:protein arginine kinase activator
MLCQICNKNQATIHLTEIVDGARTEMHTCEQCAIEQGITVKSQMPINELLGNLLALQPAEDDLLGEEKEASCPHCGFTLNQFREEAVLGCPHDYDFFEEKLAPLITKAHDGHTTHCGKIPSKTPGETKKKMELTFLNRQLNAAIKKEDYEKAARIRDEINKKEK